MDIFSVLTLIGGLSLFLFGMNYMGDSLKKLSGSRLEMILSKLTSSRFKGFLLGFGVTAIIQSSSAVMVTLVGFVNSGIMQLAQTTSVLMGANIGTTVTGWLLSTSGISGSSVLINLLKPSSFTPILAAVGLLFNMFSKSDKKKNVGSILLGFAILMFGMETMSGATEGLQDSPFFMDLLVSLSNPILGILAGTLFTAVIQSSSASVGIIQALSLTSPIPISSALPVILGMNIGAAVPPVLSSISGNTDAKRVAASCVYIKLFSVLITAPVFYILNGVFDFAFMDQNASVFSIAFMHTMFNIISTIVLMPCCKWIEKLSELTFKAKEQAPSPFQGLDNRFLIYPTFAAEKAREVTADMAEIADSSIRLALKLLTTEYSDKKRKKIREREKNIDMYEDKLNAYLVALSAEPLTAAESAEVATLLHVISDVERISDYSYTLAKTAREMSEREITLSKSASKEMSLVSDAVKEIVSLSVQAISDVDSDAALRITCLNQVIEKVIHQMKSNHIKRLQKKECSTELGFIFSNLLTTFGRISGHCSNIAVYFLQKKSQTFSPHEYKSRLQDDTTSQTQEFYSSYEEKYTLS